MLNPHSRLVLMALVLGGNRHAHTEMIFRTKCGPVKQGLY